jgi:AraC-like DNA-binding protein
MESRLDRIRSWETQARRAKYRVQRLAKKLGVTPRHLQRYFLEQFGVPPREWLADLCMSDAQRLLRIDRPGKDVATRLGFKHYTHFCRAYRRAFSTTPKARHSPRVIRFPGHVRKRS